MKHQRLIPLLVVSLATVAGSAHASIEADDVILADTIVLAKLVATESAGTTRASTEDHPEAGREVKLSRVVLEVMDTFKGDASPKRIEVAMNERDLAKTLARFAGINREAAEFSSLSARGTGVGSTAVWFLQPVNRRGKFFLSTTGSRSESGRGGQSDGSVLECDSLGFSYAVTGLEKGLEPEAVAAIPAAKPQLPPYLRLLDLLATNAETGKDGLRHLRSLFYLSPINEDVQFLKDRALGRIVPAQDQKDWVASRLRPLALGAKTDSDRLNWASLLSQWGDASGERDFVALLGKVGPKAMVVGFPHVTDPNAFLTLARSDDPEWSKAGFVALASRPGLDEQVLPIAIAQLGKDERRDDGIREWTAKRLNLPKAGSLPELRSALLSSQKALAQRSATKG